MARPFGTKNIETPEKMWEHFEKYKKTVKESPTLVQDFVGKDGDEVKREKERPLTYEGFCNYLEMADIISTPEHYFMNYQNRYADYIGVCSRIKRCIREDQISGGMVGIYNPSITQRLNGLVDKVDSTIRMEQPLFPDVSKDDSGQ